MTLMSNSMRNRERLDFRSCICLKIIIPGGLAYVNAIAKYFGDIHNGSRLRSRRRFWLPTVRDPSVLELERPNLVHRLPMSVSREVSLVFVASHPD